MSTLSNIAWYTTPAASIRMNTNEACVINRSNVTLGTKVEHLIHHLRICSPVSATRGSHTGGPGNSPLLTSPSPIRPIV
jgi:hypothetical protein